ncbi:MAG: PhnD/SsuA/transferrin family substrate-binding protein [Candidatus Marinimicrobia bacterium]|nr:PhnD/SsuA/transferrin family substrate-binding protein [Candidatus Neomarinimicrobiota bacterium]
MNVRIKAFGLVFIFISISLIGYMLAMDIETPRPILKHDNLEGREVVYFGVISRYTPRSIIEGYQPLMDYLTDKTPYHFKLRLSRNYLETVRQLTDGDIDFASLGNYTYIKTRLDHDIKCIAMPINARGNLENYDDIIVPFNSPIHTLSDLRGRTFAFASRQSFSSWMAIWMLHEAGVNLSDLSEYKHLSYHDLVAEKVLRGDFDAGMVKSVVAHQYEARGLRILARSPAIPSVPLVAGAHVDSSKLQVVQTALLNLKSIIETGAITTDDWDSEVVHGFKTGHDSLFNFPRSILTQLELIH